MLGRILRPVSIAVAIFIAGLSVLGCIGLRHSVQSDRSRILDERASAVTYLLESTFQQQLSSLKELGAVAAADPADAQETLTAGAKPVLFGQDAVLAVVRPTPAGYRIEGMVGAQQPVGSLLTGRANLTLATAGAHSLTGASMVLHLSSGPRIGIAVPEAGRIVFIESPISPDEPISIPASPFSDLGGALYAGSTARSQDLILTTQRQLPLVGEPSSRTTFLVGDNEWSVYVIARGELVGRWTAALPWLVLGAGLALALLLAFIIETLSRRRRYAEDLADQRTDSLAQANHDLDEARAFINRLVDTGPLVMMVLDSTDYAAAYVSPNIEQRFGITEADALGRDFVARFVDPQDAAAVREAIARAVDSPHLTTASVEFRMPMSGGVRWVEAALVPALNDQLPEGSVFVYALDIDERHRATQAQEAAQAAADAANRSKSDFLSRMSHELRTPLNAILGYAQILELEGLSEDQDQPVAQIISSGRHLLALINEVLDISRIETGRLSLSVEPVVVSEVLDAALNMVRPVADDAGISLFIGTDCATTSVMADRQRLQQVLLNLLTNAVKYNRLGGAVTVSCELRDGDVARISVTDTGVGINEDEYDRVFAPFERLSRQAAEVEGTGIGLALSRHLAEAMGGSIGLESEVGRGSKFWIDLPATTLALVDEAVDDDLPAPTGDESASDERVVLQIEDNPANFRLVERILGRAFGVRLLTATTAAEGLDLAVTHHPDLILLDLHLPDSTGEHVLARLQDDPLTADIAVVVISADATPATLERLKRDGASDYLTKPIDVRQLLDIVESTGAHR